MIAPQPRALSATDLLERMLAIPSVTGAEEALVTALRDELPDFGFSTAVDGAGNLLATWGAGPTDVLLLGHIDTVPGDVPVRRDGQRLHGRGAVDAKGPLAAALTAVSRQPWHGGCRFTVVAAVDEEGSSRGARALIGRPAPHHLVILEPSGSNSITIGYRGCVRARYHIDQPLSHGASGHPSAGDRAVTVLEALRNSVISARNGPREVDRAALRIDSMTTRSDGLRESCAIDIALRLPLSVSEATAHAWLTDAAGDASLEIRWSCPAVRADKNTALSRALVRGIRQSGGSPRFTTKTGTSDLNVVLPGWGCPAAVYGPGDPHLDHTPLESMEIADLERATDILTGALGEL